MLLCAAVRLLDLTVKSANRIDYKKKSEAIHI